MHCNLKAARHRAKSFLAVSGQFCTAHAHRLLFQRFDQNFGIANGFSDSNFLNGGSNLAIRQLFWHRDLDLWHSTLTLIRPWTFVGWNVIKLCTKFDRNRTIRGEIIDHLVHFAYVRLRCDLDLWPLDLERLLYIRCHVYQIWAKTNNPRLSYWLFSTFSYHGRLQAWVSGMWHLPLPWKCCKLYVKCFVH